MDSATLTRLLRGEHIGVSERLELGLWPHLPIPIETVRQHLISLLEETEWFPNEHRPHQPGEPVDEGMTVEHTADGRFVCRSARGMPWDNRIAAESGERVFGTARGAAEFYLRWALHLPGDLDGWRVTVK